MDNARDWPPEPPMIDHARTYHFGDFTTTAYRELLRRAAATWIFRGFGDARAEERFIIWRHDVDCSMHRAHALARIEAEEGIRSTYFVLPHSEMYNLLEADVTRLVREIAAMGHAIGLHLDTAYHGLQREEALPAVIAWEAALVERVSGQPVTAFSFHNPTAQTLSWQRDQYGPWWNAYAARFQSTVGYVSDSNGYWRHRRLSDVIDAATDHQLQVLTHPEWWTDEVLSPAARIERCIHGRAVATRHRYETLLQRGGRQNVGA